MLNHVGCSGCGTRLLLHGYMYSSKRLERPIVRVVQLSWNPILSVFTTAQLAWESLTAYVQLLS